MTDYSQITPKQAIALQKQLAQRVCLDDHFGKITTVAGVDVGFENKNTIARAAVAVLSFPDLSLIESRIARLAVHFPYIPGLLAFREVPVVLEALQQLQLTPDILLCDGQGIAHPRRLGIASHLGLLTNLPSIGVAKSRLIGEFDMPGEEKGDWQPLRIKGEQVGVVLRSRAHVKPLYISPGHKVSIASSMHIVMQCLTKYRFPETTRYAHKLASNV